MYTVNIYIFSFTYIFICISTCVFSSTSCCKSSASAMASLSVRCAKSNAFDRNKTSNPKFGLKAVQIKTFELKHSKSFQILTKASLMSRQILLAPILLLHSPFTWSFKKYALNDWGDMRHHKTKCCPQNYCSPDRYWLLRLRHGWTGRHSDGTPTGPTGLRNHGIEMHKG